MPTHAMRRSNRRSRRRATRVPGVMAVTAATVAVVAMAGMGGTVGQAQLPFMRNMHTGPVVLPQVESRIPVEDTIAIDGEQHRDRFELQNLPNPVPNTPAALAEGEWLYGVYCAVCHGTSGQGDGQIAEHYPRMPDLTAPNVHNYPDGWIYGIIRDGGSRMPTFAASMSGDERWTLVHFLRTLTPE